jgi:flagellar basal-body rod protein FlgB
MMISPWDAGTHLYERALDVRSAIHETIASNMANEETPGYQSRQLPFRETLAATLQGGSSAISSFGNARHMSLGGNGNEIFQHTIKQNVGAGLDDNTVNLEKEMTLMAENTILYMAVSQFLDGRFEGWKNAIAEGR